MLLNKEKIDFLYDLICEDEPPCVMCDYKCPFSNYKDGHYCEGKNENIIFDQCHKTFEMWITDQIK